MLKKGAFVISIDTELAWGSAHRESPPESYEHWKSYGKVRSAVEHLLELMDRYEVRATWAVVGRLMVDPAARPGAEWPANPQPAGKWLENGRLADPEFTSKWYAPDVVEQIRKARVRHEIGSHTFSHIVSGERGYSRELLESDLDACVAQAKQQGFELRSLVYPKNRVAHTDLLAPRGFTAYRTLGREWFDGLPRPLWRVAHKLDAFLPVPPPVVMPVREAGVWAVPASYYHRHRGGWARYQPMWIRSQKLRAGVRKAAASRSVFHVWFHPYDIASDEANLLKPLESAFKEAARLTRQGRLENLTLGELSSQLSAQ